MRLSPGPGLLINKCVSDRTHRQLVDSPRNPPLAAFSGSRVSPLLFPHFSWFCGRGCCFERWQGFLDIIFSLREIIFFSGKPFAGANKAGRLLSTDR